VEILSDFRDINNLIEKKDTLSFFVTKDMSGIINEKSIMENMRPIGDYVFISSSDNRFPDLIDSRSLKNSSQGKIPGELKENRYITYSAVRDYRDNLMGLLCYQSISRRIWEL